jgi:DNA-directed RNA polymerase specialized sigma24 family protein
VLPEAMVMAGDAAAVPAQAAGVTVGDEQATDARPGNHLFGSVGTSPDGASGSHQTAEPDGGQGRIAADRKLVEVLAADGFAGPGFDRFRDELARYAVSVLSGWMYSGYVFQLAAGRGLVLRPTAAELDELHREPSLRQELAVMVVAVALRAFREHALVGGGWRADGGASLTTYFLGACLTVFPNEFRKYRSQRQRWQAQDDSGQKAAGSRAAATGDPADLVAGTMRVRADLARMDPRTRAIVALQMDGYRQEEIAEMLGEASVRAVEGVLYRLRVKQAKLGSRGGD